MTWRGRAALGLTAVALLPVLAVVLTRTGTAYLPGGDVAYIDLRVRHLFDDFPLVGVYSRYGWSHPGPILFYVLTPLHQLFGGAAWTTLVGGALVQGIAIAAAARVAWRQAGLTLVGLVLAAITLAYVALGHLAFLTAWNPYVAFPFLALFVLCMWAASNGSRWALAGSAVVASVLVQLHVGYAPLVAAGAVWLAVVLLRGREEGDAEPSWRTVLISGGVALVLLWLPVLVEQLTNDPGNLTKIYRYVRESHDAVGLETGAGLFAAQFRVLPAWLGGDDLVDSLTGAASPASLVWLVVPVATLGLAYMMARRAQSRSTGRLVGLVSVLCVAGVLALSRVDGVPETYLFFWRGLLATLVVATLAWALAVVRPPVVRGGPGRRLALAALAAAVLVPALVLTVDVASHPTEVNPFEQENRAIIRIVAASDEADEPFIVRDAGTAYRGLSGALVDELDRRGAPVRLDRRLEHVSGEDLAARPGQVASVWYVAENGTDVSLLTDVSGAEVLARVTPLTRAQERELVRLQRELTAILVVTDRRDLLPALEYSIFAPSLAEVPGIDQASIERITALNARVERSERCRCAVIAYPPNVTPPATAWQPRPAP